MRATNTLAFSKGNKQRPAKRVWFVPYLSLFKHSNLFPFAALILLTCPIEANAGFLFQGITKPVIFVPPVNIGQPRIIPTFATNAPQILAPLIAACGPRPRTCTYIWRIRRQNQPFFPVPNGVPLIKDNTQFLPRSPFVTPVGVWGIWDPDVVNTNQVIDVFEIFAGVDPNEPPRAVVDMGTDLLASVDGYPGLTLGEFPEYVEFRDPLALDLGLDIVSNEIIGAITQATYAGDIFESDFSTLAADIGSVAVAPNFSIDLAHVFNGAFPSSGRVVFSHHVIPAGDVILYAAPEPNTMILILPGIGVFAWALRTQQWAQHRRQRKRGSVGFLFAIVFFCFGNRLLRKTIRSRPL